MKCAAAIAIAFMAADVATAVTFTPGNIIVATAPTAGGAQQITLTEYTSAGSFVQAFAIPNAGPGNFGSTRGNSTSSMQIAFSDVSNQILYVATSFTNTAGPTQVSGYVRVNASSGTLVVDEARINTRGTGDARAVTSGNCLIFNGGNTGFDRFVGPNPAEAFATLNIRFLELVGNTLYAATGTTGLSGQGIYTYDPNAVTLPATPTLLLQTTGNANSGPQGFFVADASTIYECQMNEAGAANMGIHKFANTGAWTDLGRNTSLTPSPANNMQGNDVDGVVSGSNVTLFVAGGGTGTGGNGVWRIDDTLTSDSATWQAQTATQIVGSPTALVGARSIAVVRPPPSVPSYNVNVTTTGTGFGSVVKNPPTGPYAKCSVVQLTATANPGSIFVEWLDGDNGDASLGASNPLSLLVDNDRNIKAKFDLLAGNNILALSGVGNGSINATPPNSDFPSPGGPFNIVQPTNTVVTLTATAAANWVFDHWSGDVTPGDEFFPTISVTLSANKNVTCTFLPLYRVRNFATGNGTNSITGPTPDGTGGDGFPLYRQGTQVSFSSTAGNIGSPASTWTFSEYQDAALATLSTNPIFTTAPLTGPIDVTAVFLETPNTNTAQAFGARDIVLGTIKDFFSPGTIQLREYNSAGQLVQPVITVPSTGTPSAVTDLPTGTTPFDINFDAANNNLLYVAGQGINGALPNQVGFIRTQFSAGSFIFDLAKGNQAAAVARGVTANGNDVYWSYDSGIRRYDIAGDAVSTVLGSNANTRMIEIFNSAMYTSTSSAGGNYAGGPGIFRIDDPNGTPSANLVIQVPTIALNPPNLLSFKFADANNCYIGLQAGNGYGGLEKFYFNGTNWVDQGSPLSLGNDWGRGVDVVVNGNDVRIYVQHTFATSEGRLGYIDDKLDNSLTWSDLPITDIVPLVSRGRSLAVVPAGAAPVCSTCLGDVVQDSKVNGVDIQGFVKCLLGVGGTNCQCGDFNGSGTVTSADIPPFITALTTSTSCP